MAVDLDAKLTDLAAGIARRAVQDYDRGDIERWLAGCAPAVAVRRVGMLPDGWDVSRSFPVIDSPGSTARVSLKTVFGLAGALPAVRLPSTAEMAPLARSAPMMRSLERLAGWLGPGPDAGNGAEGRLVGPCDELSEADEADAAGRLGVGRARIPYLWEYALDSGWFELADEPGDGRTQAVIGQTALRWADGDDSGALHAWAVVFAAVLAAALEVASWADPDGARKLNFRGQGVAVGVLLFLRRLTRAQVGGLIRDGAVGGGLASARTLRAWDAWVEAHGDPARVLLGDLAELGAVTAAEADAGEVSLTPLALWALREQLAWEWVDVPLLPASPARLSAADLVAIAEGATEAELATDSDAWVASRGPERAARELLAFAATAGAQARLVAVNLTRGIGRPADPAWRDCMRRPELRGYARIALTAAASELPEATLPLVLEPGPDDLTWVATDLLALACGEVEPDPREVAAQFREAIPAGEEEWIFDLMSRSTHPDVVRVLTVLGRHHPDRRIARSARRAAHAAARSRTAARPERITVSSGGN